MHRLLSRLPSAVPACFDRMWPSASVWRMNWEQRTIRLVHSNLWTLTSALPCLRRFVPNMSGRHPRALTPHHHAYGEAFTHVSTSKACVESEVAVRLASLSVSVSRHTHTHTHTHWSCSCSLPAAQSLCQSHIFLFFILVSSQKINYIRYSQY